MRERNSPETLLHQLCVYDQLYIGRLGRVQDPPLSYSIQTSGASTAKILDIRSNLT